MISFFSGGVSSPPRRRRHTTIAPNEMCIKMGETQDEWLLKKKTQNFFLKIKKKIVLVLLGDAFFAIGSELLMNLKFLFFLLYVWFFLKLAPLAS